MSSSDFERIVTGKLTIDGFKSTTARQRLSEFLAVHKQNRHPQRKPWAAILSLEHEIYYAGRFRIPDLGRVPLQVAL